MGKTMCENVRSDPRDGTARLPLAPLCATNPAMSAWPKACRCGETWSRAEWSELPAVGRYLAGSEGWLELRSCVCGATLTVDVRELGDGRGEAAPRA